MIKKFVMGCALLTLAGLVVLCGCSRSASTSESNDFFASWLRGHGESNVVVDAQGVGLAGNTTRLRSSLYSSEQHTNGSITAELDFRVQMPDKREVVEYVAGAGDSLEKAEGDAKANFALTTLHVVYGSFLNTNDPHHAEEKVTIGGQPRLLVMGDTMTRGETTNSAADVFALRDQVRKALAPLPLSPQTHWIKIIYANNHSNMVLCAVTLDNQEDPKLAETIQNLPWPRQEKFYMAKQFIVIK